MYTDSLSGAARCNTKLYNLSTNRSSHNVKMSGLILPKTLKYTFVIM